MAAGVCDDISTLATEWTRPDCRKNFAFDIALAAMIDACDRHGDHGDLGKLLGHYRTCWNARFDRSATWPDTIATMEEATDDLERCAVRIGEGFREEAYAGRDAA